MKRVLIIFLILVILFSYGCKKEEQLTYFNKEMSIGDFTQMYTTSTDREGRVTLGGDSYNGYQVGVFYHVWHGEHEVSGKVLNITKELEKNPLYLTNEYINENAHKFHYWDEPLYGYYCSKDPWIITRHIELMINMGIDFLAYDFTNSAFYADEADLIFEILDKFYNQGLNVPKVTFYTNTNSPTMILKLYDRYLSDSSLYHGKYNHLWYSPNGKPLIIGRSEMSAGARGNEYKELINNFFDFRESQWPDGKTTVENLEIGFPWMDWGYPQVNYNGYMSVSLSQHPGAQMSKGAKTNFGRGYDFNEGENITENAELGTNYQSEWNTVFLNNSDSNNQQVKTVMITGFNEWMAIKLNDGENSMFVDCFSEEYSRDIEMMKGGYDDNFVLQTLYNTRKFKYTEQKRYLYTKYTIDLTDTTFSQFDNCITFKDLEGDALARNFRDAFSTTNYVDNSNRNDIVTLSITHDDNNLYVRVKTKDDITTYNGSDKNWMNLLIKTTDSNDNTFGGFNYIINRSPSENGTTSVEVSTGGYNFKLVGNCTYVVSGNNIVYSIPLAILNISKDRPYVRIKASDNVTNYDDIMDYYISGDSAPIGRFAYSYGY